jgi:hypothetical protein
MYRYQEGETQAFVQNVDKLSNPDIEKIVEFMSTFDKACVHFYPSLAARGFSSMNSLTMCGPGTIARPSILQHAMVSAGKSQIYC